MVAAAQDGAQRQTVEAWPAPQRQQQQRHRPTGHPPTTANARGVLAPPPIYGTIPSPTPLPLF